MNGQVDDGVTLVDRAVYRSQYPRTVLADRLLRPITHASFQVVSAPAVDARSPLAPNAGLDAQLLPSSAAPDGCGLPSASFAAMPLAPICGIEWVDGGAGGRMALAEGVPELDGCGSPG